MKTYKVFDVEHKISGKGNAYKKLVLQEPNSQYPLKNVTMFAKHPLFEDIAPGQTVELDIETKDSDTPNSHAPGTFFKNRIVLNPGQTAAQPTQAKQPEPATPDSRIMNALTLKVIPLLENIRKDQMAILEKMRLTNPYPEMNETNDAHGFDEITTDSTPF